MKIEYDAHKCVECYECVKWCTGALSYYNGAIIFNSDNCSYCETCVDVCDRGAIEVKG